MYKLFRIQLLVLTALVFAYGTYAFASSSSNVPSGAEGVNAISGWAVSNVSYRFTEDSSKIAAVEFDLDGAARTVRASINSSSPTFFGCVNTAATHWVCDVNQQAISTADSLKVIAADS